MSNDNRSSDKHADNMLVWTLDRSVDFPVFFGLSSRLSRIISVKPDPITFINIQSAIAIECNINNQSNIIFRLNEFSILYITFNSTRIYLEQLARYLSVSSRNNIFRNIYWKMSTSLRIFVR